MTRSLPSGMATALASSAIEPFYAVELLFDSGAIRLWTGFGDKTIDGQTYLGSGDFLNISDIEEVGNLNAKGITLTLSGINSTIMSYALTEAYQGRTARVLFGLGGVSDTVEVFAGLMDVMSIKHSGESVQISMSVESKLVTLRRANVRRYTSSSHKSRNAGDTFFDSITTFQDKVISWGRSDMPASETTTSTTTTTGTFEGP